MINIFIPYKHTRARVDGETFLQTRSIFSHYPLRIHAAITCWEQGDVCNVLCQSNEVHVIKEFVITNLIDLIDTWLTIVGKCIPVNLF